MDNQILNNKDMPRKSNSSHDLNLAFAVDMRKEWESNLEKNLSQSASSIHEPEKTHRRTVESDDDAASSHDDLEGGTVSRTVTAQDWTGPDDPEVGISTRNMILLADCSNRIRTIGP
jgi:hypothetical protein